MKMQNAKKQALDVHALPAIIQRVRDEYALKGIATKDIGNGWCDNFANDVLTIWVGEDWVYKDGKGFDQVETGQFVTREGYDAMDWDWPLLAKYWNIQPPAGVTSEKLLFVGQQEPSHVWIACNGRHYDAESPDGEESFFDLMFFKRWLGLVEK